MSTPREFSHITIISTPYKKRIDDNAKKTSQDIERDWNTAYKCADRFNYQTNLHKKVGLSDRIEMALLGFEMKGKASLEEKDETNVIYRKEKKHDNHFSPLPAGMSPQNPLPAGRGFILTPSKNTPQKRCQPVFDDIPSTFV